MAYPPERVVKRIENPYTHDRRITYPPGRTCPSLQRHLNVPSDLQSLYSLTADCKSAGTGKMSSGFVSQPCRARPCPPGFMHPDAHRAKKPPIHSGWWGMLRLRRAKRRIERTENQDTKDWRRTYLTGRIHPPRLIFQSSSQAGCRHSF